MRDGDPIDATFSTKTKEMLQKLVSSGSAPLREAVPAQSQQQPTKESRKEDDIASLQKLSGSPNSGNEDDLDLVRIVVPLKNNDEFFQILQHGLSSLNTLHNQEKTTLQRHIGELGQSISKVANPSRSMQRADLYAWRAIFGLYLDCNVFFSTSESENFVRTPAEVQKQLQLFSDKLNELKKANRFRRKESDVALQSFLLINADLLRNLKFQQLNMRATGKILKSKWHIIKISENGKLITTAELDKRTSLGAQQSFSAVMDAEALSPQIMAKYMCSQMSNEILAIVPQLDDYLCPVCFSISYKPVRLKCGHVFCIRCMVVMQRSRQPHCPLCRGDVVMQADSGEQGLCVLGFPELMQISES